MIQKITMIAICVLLMIILLIMVTTANIHLDTLNKPVKVEEIVVETFDSTNLNTKKSGNGTGNGTSNVPANASNMCAQYAGNMQKLQELCSNIKSPHLDNCNNYECCVLACENGVRNCKKNSVCMAGGQTGPYSPFIKNFDRYYFLRKLYKKGVDL
tara:strand:+ start:314 stop:781 length:468 start_codon:yes stop_codon:yes gene_type:complete